MTTLLHMEPCAKECTEILMERLKELAQTQTVFNLQYWLQCYAFDVIGLITVSCINVIHYHVTTLPR